MKPSALLLLSVFIFVEFSQAQLQPSIGLTRKPLDSEKICKIPLYTGSFSTSGIQKGAFAKDFKLYGMDGDSFQLSTELAKGKSVLIVAGSLTCPVFMGKIATINQVMSVYGDKIKVIVVYVIEAHPTDTSPYFGFVNVTSSNQNAGILFRQPLTYGERKHLVDTMGYWAKLNAPVFIDGPCNAWWTNFGPAPNNAYLIHTTGKIEAKHGWFHKNPDNIFCDIDQLLKTNSGLCTSGGSTGTFNIQNLNTEAVGKVSEIIYAYVNLINNSTSPVTLSIKKGQKNMPAGWQTAICADVCYSPTDDSVNVTLSPKDTLLMSMDFITDATPATGSIKVQFRNISNINNKFQITFKATSETLKSWQLKKPSIKFYPNPVGNAIFFENEFSEKQVTVFNSTGISQIMHIKNNQLEVVELPDGLYFLKFENKGEVGVLKFIKSGRVN